MGIQQNCIKDKKVLVIGVTGQIARGLAYVLSKNNEVHGVARFTDPRIEQEVSGYCHKLWKIDLREKGSLDKLPKDFYAVFNQAVLWDRNRTTKKHWNEFIEIMKVNSFLPARIMEYFADSAKLVFGSTGGLYEPSKDKYDLNKEDETSWRGGDSIYEDTKMANDIILLYLSEEKKIPAALLRYYWPASPYRSSRAASITRRFLKNEPVTCSIKDPWWQNFGYISDLVYATIASAEKTNVPAEIYNITGSEIVCAKDIGEAVAEELGIEPIFNYVDRESDRPMYLADVSKMERDLWKPRIGLKEYVRRVVKAVKEDIHSPEDWMFE